LLNNRSDSLLSPITLDVLSVCLLGLFSTLEPIILPNGFRWLNHIHGVESLPAHGQELKEGGVELNIWIREVINALAAKLGSFLSLPLEI
jgi:hypothetical protein